MLDPAGAQERRRRRALLRAHHPDLGGDAEQFAAAVRDAGRGRPAPGPGPVAGGGLRFVRRPRGLARILWWWRGRRRSGPPRVR